MCENVIILHIRLGLQFLSFVVDGRRLYGVLAAVELNDLKSV